MTISVYKDQDVSQKTASAALPKVNVRPTVAPSSPAKSTLAQEPRAEASAPYSGARAELSAMLKPYRKDWDIRFAIGLIAVVVLVNITLTLLLGDGNDPISEEQATILMEPAATSLTTEGASTEGRSPDVYISSEEKRLLLRHLYAPTPRAPHPQNNERGTYRSLSESQDQPLSIIGAGPSAGE